MKETKNPFNEKNAASKGMIIVLLFIVVIACVLFFMKGMSSTNSNKDGIKENINYKVKEKNATYVTYKSKDYDKMWVYKEPDGQQKAFKIREALPCKVTGTTDFGGETWYQIEYCGLTGFIQSEYLRYVSGEDYSFSVDGTLGNKVYVNEDKIKLHTKPKQKSKIAAEGIPYGKEFKIKSIKNGWREVSYREKTMYIDMTVVSWYLPSCYQVEICNGKSTEVNLRKKPNEDSKSKAKIPAGYVFAVMENYKNGWGQVTYNGQKGWVKLKYTTCCGPEGLSASEDYE